MKNKNDDQKEHPTIDLIKYLADKYDSFIEFAIGIFAIFLCAIMVFSAIILLVNALSKNVEQKWADYHEAYQLCLSEYDNSTQCELFALRASGLGNE